MAADVLGKFLQIIGGFYAAAIATRHAVELVGMFGDQKRSGVACPLAVEQFTQRRMVEKPACHCFGGGCGVFMLQLAQVSNQVVRAYSGHDLKIAQGFCTEVGFFALQFGNKLLQHQRAPLGVGNIGQLACQCAKADLGIDHHGLHLADGLHDMVDLHSIKNAKGLFANLWTKAGGTPHHLFVENAAVNATQKDQIANFRHIDARGQQIDCDRNGWVVFVFVAPNQLQGLIRTAGDFAHRIVIDGAIIALQCCFQEPHH